jgi:stress response protein SCP2
VDYGISATSGNITVKGNNSCGDGTTSTLAITVNPLPVAAGTIMGSATVCQGQNSVTYTVPTITDATSYIWTLPSGATGTSATNSITVDYGISATSGNITVKGNNSCGDGTTSTLAITVSPLPVAAGTIMGSATVCQGQNSVTYTVQTITDATSYIWTLPSGATGTSATNSITVDYSISATSGNITVKGNNSCGDGTTSTLAITVNLKPTTPIISLNGLALLSNAVNGNQWYDQNGLIIGATNQNFNVSNAGVYYVMVTLNNCSSDTSNNITINITGFEFIEANSNIKVYPNPVSNELIIEIDGNNEKVNFDILNAVGQVLFKGNLVKKTTVQTSNFVPGVYLIKLENGKTFEFKKIIKE